MLLKILVLCTGNSCRSQIAEGYFWHFLKAGRKKHTIVSAGLEAHGLNPRAVIVMREAGIDISSQKSKRLVEFLDEEFDFIVTVCDNAAENCPVFPGRATRLHWPFDDPAKAEGDEEQILEKFRQVRDQIEKKVKSWLSSLS